MLACAVRDKLFPSQQGNLLANLARFLTLVLLIFRPVSTVVLKLTKQMQNGHNLQAQTRPSPEFWPKISLPGRVRARLGFPRAHCTTQSRNCEKNQMLFLAQGFRPGSSITTPTQPLQP